MIILVTHFICTPHNTYLMMFYLLYDMISYNYIPYYQFACWDCRMSSAALELGFTCPITNTIMFSPTTASDGQCYERHAIQVWIATGESWY